MDSDQGLGERIRRLRAERGLSLAGVAGEDFSRAFLNQVEHGRSRPSTRVLRVIASRLGTHVDYLLGGTSAALDADIAIELARLDLVAGRSGAALRKLRPHLGLADWPAGFEARVAAARALIALRRSEAALTLLAEAERMATAQSDSVRSAQVTGLRSGAAGAGPRLDAATRQRLGRRALREGRREAALEHLRAARILAEAQSPSGKVKEGGGSTTGGVISRVMSI